MQNKCSTLPSAGTAKAIALQIRNPQMPQPLSKQAQKIVKACQQEHVLLSRDVLDFLNARRWPARLTVEQTSIVLGFPERIIRKLAVAGYLPICGDLGGNAVKYFATVMVLRLANEEKWLNTATQFAHDSDKSI